MIIDDIKKDNLIAMKEHNTDARNIFGVVMNKILLQQISMRENGKTFEDVDAIQIIQKTIKELNEEKENYLKMNNTVEADKIDIQKAVIEKYLPKMLSEEEVKNIIATLEDKSMPSIMKHFKANYAGKVDMGIVNKLARG